MVWFKDAATVEQLKEVEKKLTALDTRVGHKPFNLFYDTIYFGRGIGVLPSLHDELKTLKDDFELLCKHLKVNLTTTSSTRVVRKVRK